MKKVTSTSTDGVAASAKKDAKKKEKAVTENRRLSGRFVKGASGNPKGRTPMPEDFKKACLDKTLDALKVVVSIMEDVTQPAASRLKAAQLIIERAYGTPVQTVETSVDLPECGVVLLPPVCERG